MSAHDDETPVTTLRLPGIDVARALAVFGMVLVNFRGKMQAYHDGWPALVWLGDRIEGKAGALFVVLAGVGVTLRSHAGLDFEELRLERRALLERASILLGLGLLLMHLWKWDILHFYGVYLVLAIPLLRAATWVLWSLAAAMVLGALLLFHQLDFAAHPSLWTLDGALRHVFFNGVHPVFPWFAFLLVGMAIGRLPLGDDGLRRRVLATAVAVLVLAEGVDALARWDQSTGVLGLGELAQWLRTWPRAPRPFFVFSGASLAVTVICVCIEVARRRPHHRWIIELVATGQMAFTLYVAHVLAILVPIDHGLLRGQPIEFALAYGLAFYAGAIGFSVWWRRRWEYGPLEGLIRQITGRTQPGPWGGGRLRERSR